jgi:hypothetical protein
LVKDKVFKKNPHTVYNLKTNTTIEIAAVPPAMLVTTFTNMEHCACQCLHLQVLA